jgi:hypothetical protein
LGAGGAIAEGEDKMLSSRVVCSWPLTTSWFSRLVSSRSSPPRPVRKALAFTPAAQTVRVLWITLPLAILTLSAVTSTTFSLV